MHSENQSAIAIAYGNQQHARMKHFDIRLYFIRDTIEEDKILIKYLPTEQMVADIFTKALPGPRMKIQTCTRSGQSYAARYCGVPVAH